MNLHALDIFVDVMNKGSFADVARDRNIAPSSVSRVIAGLEQELGIRLFTRTTRQTSVTEAGQAYFSKVAPILNNLKYASEAARDIEQSPQGVIRITSSVSFGKHVVVPVLDAFMQQYPQITLEYVLTDRVVDMVGERIDVAIRHGTLEDSSFISSKLLETTYRVVASPSYIANHDPIKAPEDITNHAALLFDIPQFRDRWSFKGAKQKKANVAVRGRYIVSNALALRELAMQGAGVSLLADWLIDDDVRHGRLVDVFPDYHVSAEKYDASIHLVTPSRAYMPLKIRHLLEFLKHAV